MKTPILSAAALLGLFSGVLAAADSQLLNLVMPDVKMMADVNVAQAITSPFGQYVLSQIETQQLTQIAALTGFDPTHDVTELLVAASQAGQPSSQHAGLVLALGNFNVATLSNLIAQQKVPTESYRGVTIYEDPKAQGGLALLSGSIVAAGDLANLKAAIDRLSSPSILPAALVTEIGQLSAANDAWALSTVPILNMKVPADAPGIPGLANGAGNALSTVQSFNAGIKFGADVVVTAQAQADNAQDASGIAGLIQFVVNMAQMKAAQEPAVQALAKALTVTASGATVNLSLTMPNAQFQQLLPAKSGPQPHAHPHQ